jgi:glutamate synthase domain-containing protein 2
MVIAAESTAAMLRQRLVASRTRWITARACLSTASDGSEDPPPRPVTTDFWTKDSINAAVGHSFPDFIEFWDRNVFRNVGYGLVAGSTGLGAAALWHDPGWMIPAGLATILTAGYWRIGLQDMKQQSHAVRRNYPVLGNMRYVLETLRPELRQYIVEADTEGAPFDRNHRALIYQRAKNVVDTIPFGTRRNVYDTHYEWACHSMYPSTVEANTRVSVGTAEFGTTQPYSASALNVSGMSYGAISGNAILALSQGAKLGNFYHNTGEGGVSKYHTEGGGDIVWNIGTGYFGTSSMTWCWLLGVLTRTRVSQWAKIGCGTGGTRREFDAAQFQDTIGEHSAQIRMVELKLSQGAKPGHGGLLPLAKITRDIAQARKLPFPPLSDCHSPASHSAFSNPMELIEFVSYLRTLSNGKPIGIKMCVGQPAEFVALVQAMLERGVGPDFISVDGAEGGTGAAPPELTNSVGLPLQEGLVLVRNVLQGAGLRSKIRLNASGKISSGFSLVRTLALGADFTCAARSFMLSLGCIQALKCNTNRCPTGIATQDVNLQYGLDPTIKAHRVHNFHRRTVKASAEIAEIMGYHSLSQIKPNDIMRRISSYQVRTLEEQFPSVEEGSLLTGTCSNLRLQELWDQVADKNRTIYESKWIY